MDKIRKTDNRGESRKRILLVDDNPSYAEIVSINLESAGYEVIVVDDGLEELYQAKKTLP